MTEEKIHMGESCGQSSSFPTPEQAPKVSNIEEVIPAVVPQNSITLPDQTKERRGKTDTQAHQSMAELNLEDYRLVGTTKN